MAEIVRMPKLSDTMTEGVVAEWHKNVGDQVESGEVLAEIETDKATMEFESFQDGALHIGVDKGATAAVDSILAILGEAGEGVSGLLAAETEAPAAAAPAPEPAPAPPRPRSGGGGSSSAPAPAAAPAPAVAPAAKVAAPAPSANGKIKASPLAARLPLSAASTSAGWPVPETVAASSSATSKATCPLRLQLESARWSLNGLPGDRDAQDHRAQARRIQVHRPALPSSCPLTWALRWKPARPSTPRRASR